MKPATRSKHTFRLCFATSQVRLELPWDLLFENVWRRPRNHTHPSKISLYRAFTTDYRRQSGGYGIFVLIAPRKEQEEEGKKKLLLAGPNPNRPYGVANPLNHEVA